MKYNDRMRSVWARPVIRHSTVTSSSQTSTFHAVNEAGSAAPGQPGAVYFAGLTVGSRPNSLRGAKFAALQETLLTLSTFPSDHEYHLDAGAAARASSYLGILANNLDIDAPRFFPQDGEAAVLTWDLGVVKRLLTIDADEEDLMDINRRTMVRCDHELPEDVQERLGALLEELGAQHLTFANSSADADV